MEQPERRRGGRTLFRRMLAFLLAILLVQMLITLSVFFFGGVLNQVEGNAFAILSERVAVRRLDLENDMVRNWSNLQVDKDGLMSTVERVLTRRGLTPQELLRDRELCQEVLSEAAEDLVRMLRRTGVTGAFAILDCPTAAEDYPGVYIRDYDPTNYAADNGDLLLERGLPQVARALSIPMNNNWSALFRFGMVGDEARDFYYHPMEAIQTASLAERQSDYFYHWSNSFTFNDSDRPVVAYSVPLVWEDGTVLGVIGVDLTVDYLAERLTYAELGENQSGAYFLGVSRDGGASYTAACTSGPMFRAYFGQDRTLRTVATAHSGIVTLPDAREGVVYGALHPLKLYNSNTPFENEQWALIGIQSEENLLSFSNQVRTLLFFSIALALVVGLLIIFMAARSFTGPVSRLVADLRRSDPNKPIHLGRLNITELDALSESIEELSNAAAESASHISKIIAMSHMPVGVFEYRKRTGRVFCSKSLFALLGWPERPDGDELLPEEEFIRRLHTVTEGASIEREGQPAFRVLRDGEERWVQLFYRDEDEGALGTFLDVTRDVETQRRIEYERDYDVLTGLYNRRAFDERVAALFRDAEERPMGVAALIMLDLDNLKYMNDTYGHDYGDRYLRSFGELLGYFRDLKALVGRRSGDEFNVFLYGYENEEHLRAVIVGFQERLRETTAPLPGEEVIKVRASGGMAWYGKDATNYAELLRMADFAMYNVKHTAKGALREFDKTAYDAETMLIRGKDALNRMLENRMVRYALQPILSAKDGTVFGYEFLMRPMLAELDDLDELFRLARNQSKLGQMEELTWTEAMSRFAALVRAGQVPDGTRAFINSMGNQQLPESLIAEFEERYPDILGRIVTEITESDAAEAAVSIGKRDRVRAWGGMLALDDYGSGYNSESVLVDVAPDLVKIDINMVRSINNDGDRLAMVRHLVEYAGARGILVLAEGVESAQELETLIACGVDYVQGFYLAKPGFGVPPVSAAVTEEITRLRQIHFPNA